jgi:hypothetical protein
MSNTQPKLSKVEEQNYTSLGNILGILIGFISPLIFWLVYSGESHAGFADGLAILVRPRRDEGALWITLAAALALAGVGGMLGWMRNKARHTLGKPHPGLAWYVVAMACLGLGLIT